MLTIVSLGGANAPVVDVGNQSTFNFLNEWNGPIKMDW